MSHSVWLKEIAFGRNINIANYVVSTISMCKAIVIMNQTNECNVKYDWLVPSSQIPPLKSICCLYHAVGPERLSGFILGFRSSGDMKSNVFLDEEICHVHQGHPGPGETVEVMCHVGGPTHARYVYIYLPGDERLITLCEVEVYAFTGMWWKYILINHFQLCVKSQWLIVYNFLCLWTSNMSSYYTPLPGKHAAVTDVDEDQCFLPQAAMTATSAVEITDILQDSNYSSCLRLVDRTGPRIHITIPVLPNRVVLDIHLLGHSLNCSPLVGMMMSSICNCDNGGCTASVCVTGDLFVFGTHTGCRYRCHCIGRCHAIVIDTYQYLHTGDQREICEIEIVIWILRRPHFLGLNALGEVRSCMSFTDILQDLSYNSCLRLMDRTAARLGIIIPVLPNRLIPDIILLGHGLNCSPLTRMIMSSIYNCDNSVCAVSVCIARDLVVSDTYSGCRYRYHYMERCHAIVIDGSKVTDATDQREIWKILI